MLARNLGRYLCNVAGVGGGEHLGGHHRGSVHLAPGGQDDAGLDGDGLPEVLRNVLAGRRQRGARRVGHKLTGVLLGEEKVVRHERQHGNGQNEDDEADELGAERGAGVLVHGGWSPERAVGSGRLEGDVSRCSRIPRGWKPAEDAEVPEFVAGAWLEKVEPFQ